MRYFGMCIFMLFLINRTAMIIGCDPDLDAEYREAFYSQLETTESDSEPGPRFDEYAGSEYEYDASSSFDSEASDPDDDASEFDDMAYIILAWRAASGRILWDDVSE